MILNEDDSHYFGSRSSEGMTLESLHAFIDQYADTQITHIFLNPNCQRTSYRSRVWDNIWEHGKQNPPEASSAKNWVRNAELLDRQGIDPYQVWIQRARQKSISPWISMRMNDAHDLSDASCFLHSSFWVDHPECRRGDAIDANWADIAFDYARPEVREYHMRLVREYFERYDFDGLELDWMRFGYHFKPGCEEEGNRILGEFHREIRRLADDYSQRRGHPIRIGVRAPSRPETARGMGLYPIPWVRDGSVDLVTITPFWATIEFDMPVEIWKDLLRDTPAELAGGLEINLRPTPKVWPDYPDNISNSHETVFGAAASLLYRGVDHIYLFNYMDSQTTVDQPEQYRPILEHAGSLATLEGKHRRHIVTYADTYAVGEAPANPLPAICKQGLSASFRIPIGPRPTGGASRVWIGLGKEGSLDSSGLRVTVNDVETTPSNASAPVPIHSIAGKVAGFEIPRDVLHDSFNVVKICTGQATPYQIVWVEIDIVFHA